MDMSFTAKKDSHKAERRVGMMAHRERTDADRAGSLMSRWSSELRRHVRDVVLRSGASGCCCALADPGARGSLPLCLPLQITTTTLSMILHLDEAGMKLQDR